MPKVKKRKSKIIQIDIDHVAKLANLNLSGDEKKVFTEQLDDVLQYISKLSEVEIKKVEPINHITGLENVSRKDIPTPSLSQYDAIKNAPKTLNGLFEVEAIFKEQ